MNDAQLIAYVTATAALLELPMDDARAVRVAQQLGRTLQLVRLLDAQALAVDDEPAEIYCPKPFPARVEHA